MDLQILFFTLTYITNSSWHCRVIWHIIFAWWRTGRSIYCHMTLSAMNYLLYMLRAWTASFSIRFRNGTCIIILDKQYNIANSSCHFGSYGSIWTGPYTAIWSSVPWTNCYLICLYFQLVDFSHCNDY
jgi:hypothetical protein